VSGVLERNGIPGAVAGLVTGGKDTGEALTQSEYVELGVFYPKRGLPADSHSTSSFLHRE